MYTNKLFKRIDLKANLKSAEMVSNIPIQTLQDEYIRLRNFFDKNDVLNAVTNYLKEPYDKVKMEARKKLDTAFIELDEMTKNFCNNLLGEEHINKKSYLTLLHKMESEIQKDLPSYRVVFATQQNLLATISIYVNQRKVELLTSNISNVSNNVISEIERKRCVIL